MSFSSAGDGDYLVIISGGADVDDFCLGRAFQFDAFQSWLDDCLRIINAPLFLITLPHAAME